MNKNGTFMIDNQENETLNDEDKEIDTIKVDTENIDELIDDKKYEEILEVKEKDSCEIDDRVAIKLVNITKTFLNGTIKANTNISFEIFKNEVHALIGENGAGKSTLTSIIFGLYEQDSGDIYIGKEKVKFKSAVDARKYKIGMVHQHFKLVHNYTVMQNIILGVEPTKNGFINYYAVRKKLNALIEKYNFKIDLDAKISTISVSDQQKVEILKLLFLDSEILIFDEPTAVLSDNEIESFLNMIKEFKKQNKTIIIISHKLNEIKEVADFATVIRHGKVVSHFNVKETSVQELAEAMVGRTLNTIKNDSTQEFGDVILKVSNLKLSLLKNPDVRIGMNKFTERLYQIINLSTTSFAIKKFFYKYFYDYPKYFFKKFFYAIKMIKDQPELRFTINPKEKLNFDDKGISFEVKEGEIFAIAGVSGNGQSEFVEYVSGLKKAPYGTIFIKNGFRNNFIDISFQSIKNIYNFGMSFVPEDRHKHGLFLDESISFNLVSNQLHEKEFNFYGFLNFPAMNNNALKIINDFDVRGVSSLQSNARGLSGGNQQKMIIGREINKDNKLIIFAQPTRGLDLGAIEYIHGRILDAKKNKKAILLISYELDEILSLADTIAVFNKDQIVGIGNKNEMTRNKIAELMAHTNFKQTSENENYGE